LFIQGTVDGTVSLANNNVTIGKTGNIKGTITARAIMVEGSIEGELKASEKVILKKSAKVKGNISSVRLTMEDGCYFQGGIDMTEPKPMQVPPKVVGGQTSPNSGSGSNAPSDSKTTPAPGKKP
jgi:cytoskeletal protein CcmA (bactofilin family)